MKGVIARVITYGVVTILVAAALVETPRLPERQPAAEILGPQHQSIASLPLAMLRQRIDTLGRGESLRGVFARGGVTQVLADQAIKALTIINPGRVRAGMPIVFRTQHPDSAPSEIILQLAIDRLLHLKRSGTSWSESEEQLPWKTDTIAVSGSISSTLYEAMDSSAKTILSAAARLCCRC